MAYYDNIQLDNTFTYQEYMVPSVTASVTTVIGAAAVTTITGGGGGQVTGPTITISGGATGYQFTGSGNTLSLSVSNATTVRTSISAAKSGANSDISSFTALTGNTGFAAWTGTADKTSHATYPATVASAAYVQAELQGVMDKLKQITEAYKAVEDALLAWGGVLP